MLDSSEVIDLRARLEAAERERDELRLAVESEMRKTIKAHADLHAAESALGACREALEEVMQFIHSEHQRGASEAMYYGAAFEPRVEKLRMWDVLADTTAAGAQRDERLRAEMKERCAKVVDGWTDTNNANINSAAANIAAAIRALGREQEGT